MAITPRESQNDRSRASIQQTVSIQTEIMSMLAGWVERGPPLVTAMLDERNHHVTALSGEVQNLKAELVTLRRQLSDASYEKQRLSDQIGLEKTESETLRKRLSDATAENDRLQSRTDKTWSSANRNGYDAKTESSNHEELQKMLQDAKQRLDLGNVRCREVIKERDQALQKLSDVMLWKQKLLDKLSNASKQSMNLDNTDIAKYLESLENKVEQLKKRVRDELQRADNETRRAREHQKRADQESKCSELERKRANRESMKAEVEKVRADKEKCRADEEMSRANVLLAELLDAKQKLYHPIKPGGEPYASANGAFSSFSAPRSHPSTPNQFQHLPESTPKKKSSSSLTERKEAKKKRDSDRHSEQAEPKDDHENEEKNVGSSRTSKVKKSSLNHSSDPISTEKEPDQNKDNSSKSEGSSKKDRGVKGTKKSQKHKNLASEADLSVSPPIKKPKKHKKKQENN